jgi:hypothetical protein
MMPPRPEFRSLFRSFGLTACTRWWRPNRRGRYEAWDFTVNSDKIQADRPYIPCEGQRATSGAPAVRRPGQPSPPSGQGLRTPTAASWSRLRQVATGGTAVSDNNLDGGPWPRGAPDRNACNCGLSNG